MRVIFARLESPMDTIPVGTVSMFDDVPTGSPLIGQWVSVDSLNKWRFPRGTSLFSLPWEVGGEASHYHGIGMITVGPDSCPSPSGPNGGQTPVAVHGHTHTVSVNSIKTDTAISLPPYRCTTFWQKVGNVGTEEANQGDGPEWKAIFCPKGIMVKGEPGLEVKLYDVSGKRVGNWVMEGNDLVIKTQKGVFFVRMEKEARKAVSTVITR